MLFDLRSRGRRRVTRVVYIGLALLIGVGLVGFGIGGGFGGGGLLSAATSNEGTGSASFQKQIAKYRKQTKANPQSTTAWLGLTQSLLHEAGGEAYYSNNALTSKGKQVFKEVAQAWTHYSALAGKAPNVEVAKHMLLIYGVEGLDEASQEVALLQTVVALEPNNAAYYSQLAEYSYKAHDGTLGDLAAQKAVALAPAAQKKRVKTGLEEAKKTLEKEGSSSSSSSTTTSGSSGGAVSTPEGTIITTTTPSKTKK